MSLFKKNTRSSTSEKDILCYKCHEVCYSTKKGMKDDIIECDTCRNWFHRNCLEKTYTKNEWELLSDSENIMFKCQSCIEERGEKVNEMKKMREMLQQQMEENRAFMKSIEKELVKNIDKAIDKKFKETTAKQNLLEKRMDESEEKSLKKEQAYEERFQNIEKQLSDNLKSKNDKPEKLESMINEVKKTEVNIERMIQAEVGIYLDNKNEKERKKQNLIIQRVIETEEKEEEQKSKDKDEVKKIIQITNPELLGEIDDILKEDKNIIRLGRKKADKPRPIRVILNDEEMKRDILKRCKNLKESAYKHISVQEDLTREEQEKQFKLRQELRKQKEEGQKVCIYRGEIIPIDQHPGKAK